MALDGKHPNPQNAAETPQGDDLTAERRRRAEHARRCRKLVAEDLAELERAERDGADPFDPYAGAAFAERQAYAAVDARLSEHDEDDE